MFPMDQTSAFNFVTLPPMSDIPPQRTQFIAGNPCNPESVRYDDAGNAFICDAKGICRPHLGFAQVCYPLFLVFSLRLS
jgi:hypothetical protein